MKSLPCGASWGLSRQILWLQSMNFTLLSEGETR
jgi:hypothetical protein